MTEGATSIFGKVLGIVAGILLALAVGCSGAPPAAAPDAGGPVTYTGRPLLPPPAHGLQLDLGPFDVPAGGEKLMCQYVQLPAGAPLEVTRYEVQMTSGSHHFVMVDANATTPPRTDLFDCSADGEIFGDIIGLAFATQDEHDAIAFPPGIAVHVRAGQVLLLQSHFFNLDPTGATHTAYVTLNVETAADPSAITEHAGYIGFSNTAIDVPPHSQQTLTKDCYAQAPYRILGLAGHFHRHGTLFSVLQIPAGATAGTTLYETTNWDHPFPKYYLPPDKPLPVGAGDDIQFSCSYDNTTDQPLVFGPSALTNEMCILFGYYYPSFWSAPLLCY